MPRGAIPESVVFKSKGSDPALANGFEVPYGNGQPQPEGLINALEQLDRVYKDPQVRARMVRAAFGAQKQVNIDRVASEMIKLYSELK